MKQIHHSEIVAEMKERRSMAGGAEELSLYLYPALDPSLNEITVSRALRWIPYISTQRIARIMVELDLNPASRLVDLFEVERKTLSNYLNGLRSQQRAGRGQASA